MAGVYSALRGFALAQRVCGELRGDAAPLTPAATASGPAAPVARGSSGGSASWRAGRISRWSSTSSSSTFRRTRRRVGHGTVSDGSAHRRARPCPLTSWEQATSLRA
jgi:hypothetical protein